jgi:hypothetical protein
MVPKVRRKLKYLPQIMAGIETTKRAHTCYSDGVFSRMVRRSDREVLQVQDALSIGPDRSRLAGRAAHKIAPPLPHTAASAEPP